MHSKIETYHFVSYDFFSNETDIDKYRDELTYFESDKI